MKYLSVDQSARTTGYAIYEDNKLVHSGTFTIPSKSDMGQRLHDFCKKISELYYGYDFEYVFFEGIQYQNNAETYKKLAMVQGMIMYWCYITGIKYLELVPSHWRKIIKENFGIKFGKSRAEQKKAAQTFVKEHFELDKSEDECDAICIGLAGIQEKAKNVSAF